jgi:hypothetical protein
MKAKLDVETLKTQILSTDWQESKKAIEQMKAQRISDELFDFVLALKNENLLIGDFLTDYDFYSASQLKKLKKFTWQQLAMRPMDSLLVSDLLQVTSTWNLTDFYAESIELIEKYPEDDILVMAALNYIFENTSLYEVPNVIQTLEKVCDSPDYYQNCQLVAAFYLYRWTQRKEDWDFLKELAIINDNSLNLHNLLQGFANQAQFFGKHDELKALLEK